jgi:hypothetical protein
MKSLCVIEFPGVLSDSHDTSAVVGALGGADAIRAATKPPASPERPALSLTLRPGELSSRSNIGSKSSADVKNEFLLHITTGEGNESEHGRSSSARTVNGEITARISARISFPGISDFQYFEQSAFDPLRRSSGGADTNYSSEIMSRSVASGVIAMNHCEGAGVDRFGIYWREKTELEHIRDIAARVLRLNRTGVGENDLGLVDEMRPARFARTAIEMGASESWFKQFLRGSTDLASAAEKNQGSEVGGPDDESRRPSRLVSEDKRTAANRLESLPYRVDRYAENIPEAACIPKELTPRLSAVVRYLKTKFQYRPIWNRRKLLYDSPDIVRKDFKASIPHAAYSFSSLIGPFHLLWIRYGYDPRMDVEARKFQVIEIRVKDIAVLEAMRQRWGSRLVQSTGEDLDVAGNHSVSELPCKRQLTLQLCDIDAPGLDDLLQDPNNIQDEFDPLNGYLTKRGIEEIIGHVKRRLRQHAVTILGDVEVQRVLGLKRLGKRRKSRRDSEAVNASSSVQIADRSEEASLNDRVVAAEVSDFDMPNASHLAGASFDFVANDVEDDLDEMRRAAVAAAAQDREYQNEGAINQITLEIPEDEVQESGPFARGPHSGDDKQYEEEESNSEGSADAFDTNADDNLSSLLSGVDRMDEDGDEDDIDDEAVVNADDGNSVEGIEIFDEESDEPDCQDVSGSDDDGAKALEREI